MKSWSRPLGYVAVIAVIAVAYFMGSAGRGDNGAESAATLPPDPGYAARDAVVVETGFDGRERYRLNAKVIRQQMDSNVIDLEGLEMDYHPGAQERVPGEARNPAAEAETWHLKSDRGQVRAGGDDVELNGNVIVTGEVPGTGAPVSLTTTTMRINTPTEFIETNAPVTLNWSGHQLEAIGFEADLKRGNLRLKSEIHGKFSPQ